jgi:hypothetical protein
MKTLVAVLLLLPLAVLAQDKKPTEAQCRQAVDGLIQAMKAAPMPERDKKGAQAVIDRAEKVVRENRARGASECESWGALNRIVTNQ